MEKPDDLPKGHESLLQAAHDAGSAHLSVISDESQRSAFRELAQKLGQKLQDEGAKMATASLERLAAVVKSLKDCLFVFVCFVY